MGRIGQPEPRPRARLLICVNEPAYMCERARPDADNYPLARGNCPGLVRKPDRSQRWHPETYGGPCMRARF